jgi:HK97 family phage prohead protease
MPWTIDDPPPPARSWTESERRRCVEAANAVLDGGGTDEEAIYACINAAGKEDDDMSKTQSQAQERKAFPCFIDIKQFSDEADDQGIVEAVVAVFGNIDEGGDILHPGAFTKTLQERGHKVRVLNAHNSFSLADVIGKPLEIREIPREDLPFELQSGFPEVSGGLYTKTQYLMNTPEGKGAFERIKAGAVDEYSFGYDAVQVDFDEVERGDQKISVRNLRQVRLWEYSPVVFAMNAATATVGVKDSVSTAPDDVEIEIDATAAEYLNELKATLDDLNNKLSALIKTAAPTAEAEPNADDGPQSLTQERTEALLKEIRELEKDR